MFLLNWFKKRKSKKTAPPLQSNALLVNNQLAEKQPERLNNIEQQVALLQKHFVNRPDVMFHRFVAGPDIVCAVVYIQGMIDQESMQLSVLGALHAFDSNTSIDEFVRDVFDHRVLPIARQNVHPSIEGALRTILNGNAVLLIDGETRILQLSLASWDKGAIEAESNGTSARGSKEAFIEDLETNLTLLRKRLKTPSLKIELLHMGRISCTSVAVTYLEGICTPQLLDDVKLRMLQIDLDALIGSRDLEVQMEDYPYSPFPQLQRTDRPDAVCAALLEGRVAIIVDGDPIAIIAPTTLLKLLQSTEDHEQRFIKASWIGITRVFLLFIALLLPSVYVAITTFHPEMLPGKLLFILASTRRDVPFSTLVEALLFESFLEALRTAAMKLPKSAGPSLLIAGGIIFGIAVIQAELVSVVMVTITAFAAIISYTLPPLQLGLSFRLLRFPILIMAGIFGLVGIVCAMALLYFHMAQLRSFGIPYLSVTSRKDDPSTG